MLNRLVWIPVNHQWGSAKLNISAVKSHAQVSLELRSSGLLCSE